MLITVKRGERRVLVKESYAFPTSVHIQNAVSRDYVSWSVDHRGALWWPDVGTNQWQRTYVSADKMNCSSWSTKSAKIFLIMNYNIVEGNF